MKRKKEGDKRMEKRLLTAKETAEYLSMHYQTVYTMALCGTLPSFKVGMSRKFDKVALDKWIESQKQASDYA